jgi:hypothetical protein
MLACSAVIGVDVPEKKLPERGHSGHWRHTMAGMAKILKDAAAADGHIGR